MTAPTTERQRVVVNGVDFGLCTVTLNLDTQFEQLRREARRVLPAFNVGAALALRPVPTTPVVEHDFSTEINAGVAYLDAHVGRDVWLPRVNLDTLQLWQEDTCVVAQVTRQPYYLGVGELGGPAYDGVFYAEIFEWGIPFGFYVDENLYVNGAGESVLYDQLTAQWKRKIEELRA